MKLSRWLLICASLSLSSVALGHDDPRIKVNGSLLGQIDALVSFCSHANPSSAKNYEQLGDKMMPGLSSDAIEDTRETRAYREEFKAVSSLLETIPRELRSDACSHLIASR